MKFKFTDEVFRINIHFIVGDREEAEKFANNLNMHDDTAGGCWEIMDRRTGETCSFLVWIKDFKDYHNMVHETLHLTVKIFTMYGIKFNADNDEIIAYYQNYWVRKFWNKMSKHITKL